MWWIVALNTFLLLILLFVLALVVRLRQPLINLETSVQALIDQLTLTLPVTGSQILMGKQQILGIRQGLRLVQTLLGQLPLVPGYVRSTGRLLKRRPRS